MNYKWLLYWHTLRYLKPVQFYARVWLRLYRPKVQLAIAPHCATQQQHWRPHIAKAATLHSANEIEFFGQSQALTKALWNDSALPKLWLYNLHYFDDLSSLSSPEKMLWQSQLITQWLCDNPPATGNGWESYPISLRVVNWIKWLLQGNQAVDGMLNSMAVQLRFLESRLEYHLLGNHLFENAKTLVFAGLFFEGAEADRWLKKGLAILTKELPEQILADGGNFELSPMYHAILLDGMLDLLNVIQVFDLKCHKVSSSFLSTLKDTLERMLYWLSGMVHPDGQITLFNDAALNIAPNLLQLQHYAARLGVQSTEVSKDLVVVHFPDTGYVRLRQQKWSVFCDVARVGPDYLPGHAHADTLSFEASYDGHRLFVDSGTSEYGDGVERQRQRGTAAHNTVMVDGLNSSEVWGGFRVARRAYPKIIHLQENTPMLTASHNGYKRLQGKVIHQRCWQLLDGNLLIVDELQGNYQYAQSFLHLHPDVIVLSATSHSCQLKLMANVFIVDVVGADLTIEPSTWHPAFGVSQSSKKIVLTFTSSTVKTIIRE